MLKKIKKHFEDKKYADARRGVELEDMIPGWEHRNSREISYDGLGKLEFTSKGADGISEIWGSVDTPVRVNILVSSGGKILAIIDKPYTEN